AFRPIRLLAGRRDDNVKCHFFHSNLAELSSFEALSYTWGDTTLSRTIHSTKGTLKLRKTVLRLPSDDLMLWIDAVCINQFSNEEKNHQVPLMGEIYVKARRAIIYLSADCQSTVDPIFDDFFRPEPYHDGNIVGTQSDLTKLLSKPWWSRVWVLREVASARNAVLIWGTSAIDWRYFSVALITGG
ncbi:HET-domain-containing protein, partial [Lentithecium fluviatile CBS 122367]